MSEDEATTLLHGSPATLPARIVEAAQAAARCRVAIYVSDIDGSCLIRVAGDETHFPERIKAPIGVGPEIAQETLPSLERICASRVPDTVLVPLVVRDRALGVLLSEHRPEADLRPLADQAGMALELTGGYTDVVHAARRRKEIRPAAEIQQVLLPPRIAVFDGDELAGGVLPGYDVAGDFFDYAANPDGISLCVADAMGKGDAAAALSSLAVGALRAARRGGATLEQTAELIDRTIEAAAPEVRFLTAVLAHWHPATSTFTWISAGHPPPLLIHADGSVEELEAGRTYPLGLSEGARAFTSVNRTIGSGQRILLYSDGVTERRRADDSLLGLDGLLPLFRSAATADSAAAEIIRAVQDAVQAASPRPLRDDATMLLLAPFVAERHPPS